MKKVCLVVLLLAMCCGMCACAKDTAANIGPTAAPVDVDLTKMGATMAYSYVINVVSAPSDYAGKRFRMSGVCGELYWDVTDATYYCIWAEDVSACCAQALEYVLPNSEYPPSGSVIEVSGVLETYEEEGVLFAHIVADEFKIIQ